MCVLNSASVSQSGRGQHPLAKEALDAKSRPSYASAQMYTTTTLRRWASYVPCRPGYLNLCSIHAPEIGFHRMPLKSAPNTGNNPSCACEDSVSKRHEAMPSLGSDWMRLGALPSFPNTFGSDRKPVGGCANLDAKLNHKLDLQYRWPLSQ